MKICTKCRQEKSLAAFPICNSHPDGKHYWCKSCCLISSRNYRRKKGPPQKRGPRKAETKLGYRVHKKDHCEHCGFIAKHRAQLDVDHIDGNHSNNDIKNLQTLCANCHRLKTIKNKECGRRRGKVNDICTWKSYVMLKYLTVE